MRFGRGKAPSYGTLQRLVSGLKVESVEAALFGWAQEALKAAGPRALATVRKTLLSPLPLQGLLNVAEALRIFAQFPEHVRAQFLYF